ncbi:hypothetical protein N781_13230 [Pontibacillus halophilus JSM 076056 = DSM 19796]|uniref:Uncharacterized protein n=1 Tax=Pontibacillus halophilus JSM 076056 = DSM 19796 TaxID=1385510 RepID=A0A0A5GM61_9BACI|nr:hypothetical protein N781_13230 [Pontibacillus halophilus JSM 076056 = DSM 19796]
MYIVGSIVHVPEEKADILIAIHQKRSKLVN